MDRSECTETRPEMKTLQYDFVWAELGERNEGVEIVFRERGLNWYYGNILVTMRNSDSTSVQHR